MSSNEQTIRPSALSRRNLLAAAGAAGIAAAGVGVGMAVSGNHTGSGTSASAPADGPIVVHVRDLSAGTLDVFAGGRHTEIRDRDLAARLATAAQA